MRNSAGPGSRSGGDRFCDHASGQRRHPSVGTRRRGRLRRRTTLTLFDSFIYKKPGGAPLFEIECQSNPPARRRRVAQILQISAHHPNFNRSQTQTDPRSVMNRMLCVGIPRRTQLRRDPRHRQPTRTITHIHATTRDIHRLTIHL